HRQQAVAAGDDARLGAMELQERQRVLDAGRALVLEGCGSLHVHHLGEGSEGEGSEEDRRGHPHPGVRRCRRVAKRSLIGPAADRMLRRGDARPEPPDGAVAREDEAMTLTQLEAFVLVARLGSVKSAAAVLGVTEPAVSSALAALRQHLGDPLVTRTAAGMELTPGGQRLVGIASQMVSLAADAEAAIRRAQGAPETLRIVATSTVAEF